MKICGIIEFFVPHYWGGGEVRFYEILRRLAQQGHEVHLLSMRLKKAPKEQLYHGIHIHRIGPVIKKPPLRSFFQFVHFTWSSFFWLAKHKYDVVDVHSFVPLLAGSLSHVAGFQPNTVATIHDVTDKDDNSQWIQYGRVAYILERILFALPFRRVINCSYDTKKRLSKFYGRNQKKLDVVHLGVDVSRIDAIKATKDETPSVLYVGRLVPHKHVEDLIQAIKQVKKKIPAVQLRIIGTGIEQKNLKQLVRKLKLQNNTVFYGTLKHYDDVLRIMKQSSVLVLPSMREGFGLVLIEANACRKPVIAYKTGGVVDIIKEGVNGFLIPPRNIERLSEAIENVLQDGILANRLGSQGRGRVERLFNWDIAAKNVLNSYKKGKIRR